MSTLRVIERLEQMLHMALEIIDEQAALLNQHGIETDDGKLEEANANSALTWRSGVELQIMARQQIAGVLFI